MMRELDPELTLTFVTGPPRSGTTLMAGMLAGGDAYPLLPECTFMTAVLRPYHAIRLYGDAARKAAYVGADDTLADLFRPVVTGFIRNALDILDVPPRRHLVLKDPELTPLLQDLPRLFPNPMRTIITVRDPRDVVASMMKATKLGVRPAIGIAMSHYQMVDVAVATATARNPVLVIRYEDVVSADKRTLDRVEEFVGYEINRRGFREVARPFDPSAPTYSELYGKAISRERVGAARSSLSAVELFLIEASFSETIRKHGYPTPRGAWAMSRLKAARRVLLRRFGKNRI